MRMLLTIAWRNVGRNRRRSAVLVGAVAFGVLAYVGSTAFMDGLGIELVAGAVDLQGGHVQVASSGYHGNPTIESRIADPDAVLAAVARFPDASAAPQVVTPGMASSTEQSGGIMIHGVDPVLEPGVTAIAERVVEGSWLDAAGDADQVVVGHGLAERLRVGLGEKIVLMASDLDNEVSAGAYRISGLYRSGSTSFDKTSVYILLGEAQRMLGFDGEVSTVTVRLALPDDAAPVARGLSEELAGRDLEALSWEERNPMIEMAKEAYDYSAVITALILFAAVGFTLVNSFLMVIFERIHELGIMLAQGVKPAWIRRMLFLEAVIVAAIGAVVGIVLATAVLAYWIHAGMDLSSFAEGLGALNVRTVIYPYLDWGHLGMGFGVIAVMVALSVLYPAIKASRFEAVEAINHV
jgi:ABC-type lipoprotein release transport system permease subunit